MTNGLYEARLLALLVTSLAIPGGTYVFLYRTASISRWSVIVLAVLLILFSGIDLVLLQSLAEKARRNLLLDHFFLSELSASLYLLPAVFAGLGVNLLTHVLLNHLRRAERNFERRTPQEKPAGNAFNPAAARNRAVPAFARPRLVSKDRDRG